MESADSVALARNMSDSFAYKAGTRVFAGLDSQCRPRRGTSQ